MKVKPQERRETAVESNPDADLAREMADVVPLAPDPRGRVSTAPPIAVLRATTQTWTSATSAADASESDESFAAPGVDRREIRKLKRGYYVPGNRLDLHGMTTAQAIEQVRRFIDTAHHRHRCVGIVHGRGLHSEGNVAILRTRVRECLRQHRAVLAFSDAPRSDGGAGAVYLLLRK